MTEVNHFAGLSSDPVNSLSRQQAGEALAARKAAYDAGERPGFGMLTPATPAHARNRLDELSADPKWGGRLLSHDAVAVAEFKALAAVASEGGAIEHALNGVVPLGYINAEPGADLRTMADFVADARGDGWDDVAIVEAMTGHDNRTQKAFDSETIRLAKNRRAERFSDPEWTRRYLAGDRKIVRESQYLSIIIGSEQNEL